MKDKYRKDFETSEEYIAYLEGYNKGLEYTLEF